VVAGLLVGSFQLRVALSHGGEAIGYTPGSGANPAVEAQCAALLMTGDRIGGYRQRERSRQHTGRTGETFRGANDGADPVISRFSSPRRLDTTCGAMITRVRPGSAKQTCSPIWTVSLWGRASSNGPPR
jgi:hypothetical protein